MILDRTVQRDDEIDTQINGIFPGDNHRIIIIPNNNNKDHYLNFLRGLLCPQ